MVDNRHKARAMGADDFAEKPVARAWLLDRLAAAVASLPRDRVLVVDDDPAARYLLAGLLEETRYEAVEASDGERALELLSQSRPSAVFLDLDMPGLPGEEVLRRIRADPSNESLPVVVYSSRALDADARARLIGASAFVSKEASRGAALTIVREAIGRAAARDEARGLPR